MTSIKHFFQRSQHIFLYAGLMALLVFVLKWLQWKFLITDNSVEIHTGLIALLFTILGVWMAAQATKSKPKTIVVEKEVYLISEEGTINETELNKLNLTGREYDVLQLVAKGYSNADIAANLFLSVSTVKTHVSNLLVKMDVKNRAQVVEKSKRLKITL